MGGEAGQLPFLRHVIGDMSGWEPLPALLSQMLGHVRNWVGIPEGDQSAVVLGVKGMMTWNPGSAASVARRPCGSSRGVVVG